MQFYKIETLITYKTDLSEFKDMGSCQSVIYMKSVELI